MRYMRMFGFTVLTFAALSLSAASERLAVDWRKPYTAISQASKSLDGKANAATDFFFDAAIAARWTGNNVQANNFLTYFLSIDKSNSVKVRRALVSMIKAGGSPEYYARYLKISPKDADAAHLGHILLEKYANEGKTRDFKEHLVLMLDTFSSGEAFHVTVEMLQSFVIYSNIQGISDGKAIMEALAKSQKWKMTPILNTFFYNLIIRKICLQELYEVYRSHRNLNWSAQCLETIASNPNVPDQTSLEALRKRLSVYGMDPKHVERFVRSYNSRFEKTPEWGKFTASIKSGAFKVPEKSTVRSINEPTDELNRWLENVNKKKISPEEALNGIAALLQKTKYWYFIDRGKLHDALRLSRNLASSSPKLRKLFPYEHFSRVMLDEPLHVSYNSVGFILDMYASDGRLKQGLDRIRASASRMGSAVGAASQRYAAVAMCSTSGAHNRDFLLAYGGNYNWQQKKFSRPDPLRDRLKFNLEAARKFSKCPVPELISVPDRSGINYDAMWNASRAARELKREMLPEEKQYADECNELSSILLVKFYPYSVSRMSWNTGVEARAEDVVYMTSEKGLSSPELPFRIASGEMTGRSARHDHVSAFAHALITNGTPELAYMILSRNNDLERQPHMKKLLTEALRMMPGLYPVNEKDPAYPLYVAAEALAANNPERAWSLLSANMKIFDQNPLRYQPAFVLWALDQYRKIRGENDVLRDKAWDHVEKLLANEASLPSDVAAGLFLLRARIAEDRMEYEIAHAGYMQLRNHSVYRKTPAGRQAMFRDVELMISMGSLDSAAQVAEQWIAQNDNEVRAQGHYILAKISFNRKDFEETRKELEKVFEIDFTHSEGRLLQGEWKLATNYEVDDTQVLLGDLSDRSVIRPGQPLSVSVKDRNLSVAGAGSSIPVLVKTSRGGDLEKVMLYPGTRDPSLFRGTVDTEMGVAVKGDHRLQIAGDDVVTYEIDPEFMKTRGIKKSEVKSLTVVDDAVLNIGLYSDEDSDERVKHIKPGVPLPIEVIDRDKSVFAAPNKVSVTVRTSSGDEITAAVLPETGHCTGVYSTNIITRIPPPRAFASDSFAGMGPEDVISSRRNGVWRSLSDGVKPKFIGVDTMSSYMVKTAAVEMPAPETAVEIKLWGSVTGGEEELLGTYPAQNMNSRGGINMVTCNSGTRNRTEFLRELSRRIITPVKLKTFGYDRPAKLPAGWMRYRTTATLFTKTDRLLKMRVKPTVKNRETLRWTSIGMYVDGRLVWNCHANDAIRQKEAPFLVEIPAGIHSLELYGSSHKTSDSYELCIVNDDGGLEPLPAEMFDPETNPEIAAHLEDKCKVLRTPRGYSATFEKPMRLRSLRWEFVDFTGSSVEVSKLNLDTVEGTRVIPGERDFTESLGNDTLEVAPGDIITVTYQDTVTSSGKSRALERRLNTMFSDGSIKFLFEETIETAGGDLKREFSDAYRVAPGDAVVVMVYEPDLNVTRGADKMKVLVTTSGGSRLVLTASERITITPDGREIIKNEDQGRFYARLRTRAKPFAQGEKQPGDMIVLAPGESIEAAYKDEDNTRPGVPCVRTARLGALPSSSSVSMLLSHTYSRRVPDKSPEGEVRLKSVRRRGNPLAKTTWCDITSVKPAADSTVTALVTPQRTIPVEVTAPCFARHSRSTVKVEVSTKNEIAAAGNEQRDPVWKTFKLQLVPSNSRHNKLESPVRFIGRIVLYSTAFEERSASASEEFDDEEVVYVDLKSGDELVARVCGEGGKTLAETTAAISTSAWMGLCDATYAAALEDIHLGESFHVMVIDPDRDVSDEQDSVNVDITAASGGKCTMELKETLGRSGIFTGKLSTDIKSDGDTNTVARADKFPAVYGDRFSFTYTDEKASFGATGSVLRLEARILPGSDGSVRGYSKRFRNADQAVLVQFRMAECLFEMAKDFRKLKDAEKSAAAIADGRAILEAALRDYPNSAHAAEGEYLLANLYEQLGEEERQLRLKREKDGEDVKKEKDKSDPLFREAVARFSAILSAWPDGDYAARSQYHKALCLERLADYAKASEEYVKMTYLFPESPLVGDAAVRLASHYYKRENRFDIAGKIYSSFRTRFPTHPQAPNALFMSGQCLIKQAEILENEGKAKAAENKVRYIMPALAQDYYKDAVDSFVTLTENYKDIQNKELLAQGLYWAGDVSFRIKDYASAYIYLKRTTFEYPESRWARFARGMLLQNSQAFDVVNE